MRALQERKADVASTALSGNSNVPDIAVEHIADEFGAAGDRLAG